MPRKVGRPCELNAKVRQQIVRHIRSGSFVDVACAAAGISKSTYYNWIKAGKAARSGPMREFVDAVKKAEAQGEVAQIERMLRGKPGWQAIARWLESRFPKRWARPETKKRDGGKARVELHLGGKAVRVGGKGRREA